MSVEDVWEHKPPNSDAAQRSKFSNLDYLTLEELRQAVIEGAIKASHGLGGKQRVKHSLLSCLRTRAEEPSNTASGRTCSPSGIPLAESDM